MECTGTMVPLAILKKTNMNSVGSIKRLNSDFAVNFANYLQFGLLIVRQSS